MLPDLKTENGIASIGDVRAAWCDGGMKKTTTQYSCGFARQECSEARRVESGSRFTPTSRCSPDHVAETGCRGIDRQRS
jgi:hypothetical protein